MGRQNTILRVRSCVGVGIHSGARVSMALAPAAVNSGIVFLRTDLTGDCRVPGHAAQLSAAEFATTLRNSAGASVATVEHLLAACAGLNIDNLLVEVNGPELPILDGSAAPMAEMLLQAGIMPQNAPRRAIRLRERLEVRQGDKFAALEPVDDGAAAREFDVVIRFADAAIGEQKRRFALRQDDFLRDIAPARTFGFLKDVEKMRAAGLGRGASYDNTVVVADGEVLNPEGLRFTDECVRHKVLDAIGDLALAGAPIIGRYVADQPGHKLNTALVQLLLESRGAWAWEIEQEREALPLAAVG